MNDKCKYCDYVSKCSRICEYNSYLCKVHRSFPKVVDKSYEQLQQEKQQLKDKLSKIETLIINHNCDTGDIYYKYNSKFLKSELKQRILEILYEEGSDSNEI